MAQVKRASVRELKIQRVLHGYSDLEFMKHLATFLFGGCGLR